MTAPEEKAEATEASAPERIVIKDNRKIGKPAEAKPETADAEAKDEQHQELVVEAPAEDVPVEVHEEKSVTGSAELGELRKALDERTADLQRITAEYANYRKRVDRDRTLSAELAVGKVLTELLPVLDDLDRAREHGDLTGPFGSVAEQITAITTKLGLSGFGEKGDPFDPNRHEAVAHMTSPEVTEATCIDVMRRGYLLGERLLRPAMVAVADPADEAPAPAPAEATEE